MNTKAKKIYSKFGANERAIVDKITNNTIKSIVLLLIGEKLSLQWSGWLQYVIPIPIILLIVLLALVAFLLNWVYIAYIFSAIALLLSIKVIFDLITVKFKIRFPESHPKRKDTLNASELMLLRHSCRSFQIKKLYKTDFEELMASVKKHMSEPKFSSEQIRFEYISAPIKVWPPVNASEFLVAIAPKKCNRLAIMDVGRTLQKVVIDATKMGLGTCWIGAGADHKSITTQLGNSFDPDKDNIICVCAIGYESIYKPLFISIFGKKMRSRLPIDSLFFTDYEMSHAIPIEEHPFKLFQKIFEACKWAPSSYNGQTTRGIIISKNNKVERIDFVATTTSRHYAAVASGIWCANWEMGCNEINIDGQFRRLNEMEISSTLKQKGSIGPVYDMSWVLNNSAENNN